MKWMMMIICAGLTTIVLAEVDIQCNISTCVQTGNTMKCLYSIEIPETGNGPRNITLYFVYWNTESNESCSMNMVTREISDCETAGIGGLNFTDDLLMILLKEGGITEFEIGISVASGLMICSQTGTAEYNDGNSVKGSFVIVGLMLTMALICQSL